MIGKNERAFVANNKSNPLFFRVLLSFFCHSLELKFFVTENRTRGQRSTCSLFSMVRKQTYPIFRVLPEVLFITIFISSRMRSIEERFCVNLFLLPLFCYIFLKIVDDKKGILKEK